MNYTKAHITSKAFLSLMLTLFGLFVGINNILSFDTNYQFVTHVLSMDTMEPWFNGSNQVFDRAITNTDVHLLTYICIIFTEITVGLLYFVSSILFLISIKRIEKLNLAIIVFIITSTIALLLWYFAFTVIGGEYLFNVGKQV